MTNQTDSSDNPFEGLNDEQAKDYASRLQKYAAELRREYTNQASGADGQGDLWQEAIQEANEVCNEHGVKITQSDPEWSMIDHGSPVRLVKTIKKAAKAKAERDGKSQPAARTGTPSGAPAGGKDLGARLAEIQSEDPWKRNPELTAERKKILEQMRSGDRRR